MARAEGRGRSRNPFPDSGRVLSRVIHFHRLVTAARKFAKRTYARMCRAR